MKAPRLLAGGMLPWADWKVSQEGDIAAEGGEGEAKVR